MTQLSPHFSLEEFTLSQTASRAGIDNDPPIEVVAALKRTALGLERVRILLNAHAIHINSGFRCEALEKVVARDGFIAYCHKHEVYADDVAWRAYSAKKQHPKGEAADFTCPTFGTPARIVRLLVDSDFDFDQCILEMVDPVTGAGGWVHISFAQVNRKQALVIDRTGTRNFQ